MSKRKTNDQFLEELKLINENIVPEEPYVNAATKIRCHCLKCGYVWEATPNALLRKSGCARCAGNEKKSNITFIKELSTVCPDIEALEDYQGNKIPILVRCKKCGNEWHARPNNLLVHNNHCPKCSRRQRGLGRRKANDVFVHELYLLNPNIVPIEEYCTSSKKIRCQCKTCGHIWSATPNNLLDKGSRCPNCSHAATSVVEQIIFKSFSIALGDSNILSRDKTAINQELDILIPDLRLAIEYGAWFWHRNKLPKDNQKQKVCEEKGIHLITVLEDCPERINTRLTGDYRIYQERLSGEKDYHTTRELIKGIFHEYGIPFSTIESIWETIIKDAILCAQKRGEEEFTALLHKVNSTISLISDYSRSDDKVICKCDICGHEWSVLPSSLLSGHGCPKCARIIAANKKKLTDEEFQSRLSIVNSNINVLEPYKKSTDKVLCKCQKCGNRWYTKPANLLSGKGCPKCARTNLTAIQSKSIRCVETGICYASIAEATRETGIFNVHKCAKGFQKTAGGYHWEYVDE